LTDASKQKRLPDPGIVPVVPRAPTKQGERVAVRVKKDEDKGEEEAATGAVESDDEGSVEMSVELGPIKTKKDDTDEKGDAPTEDIKSEPQTESVSLEKFDKVVGGAWGAGAKEDSVLLRLIREQSGQGPPPMMMGGALPMMNLGPPGMMMNMPPPNMMPPPPPPMAPPPNMMQHQDRNHTGKNMNHEQEHYGGDDRQWRNNDRHDQEAYGDGAQFRNDRYNQGPPPRAGPPHERERFIGRGHPDQHLDQYSQSQHGSPNFHRQQQPPYQGRGHPGGPPGGDFRGAPGPDRYQQHPPPHMMRGPPMGRGRGDQYFDRGGPGRGGGGGPPPWTNERKRPRDFDPRGDPRRGRW
jgi:hypothetical protein